MAARMAVLIGSPGCFLAKIPERTTMRQGQKRGAKEQKVD